MRSCIFFLLLLFSACNNTPQTPAAVDTTPVQSAPDRHDIHNCCCFTSGDDFRAFFPDSTGEFRRDPYFRKLELNCPGDTALISKAWMTYRYDTINVGVTIYDYCAQDAERLNNMYRGILLSYKDDKTLSEYNEFEEAGSHRGFSCYEPVNHHALLLMTIDNRFMVEIESFNATGSQPVMKLMQQFPIKSLGMYRK